MVDEESGVANITHVFEENGCLYSATLMLTDMTQGLNSYYRLQVVEGAFWLLIHCPKVKTICYTGASKRLCPEPLLLIQVLSDAFNWE